MRRRSGAVQSPEFVTVPGRQRTAGALRCARDMRSYFCPSSSARIASPISAVPTVFVAGCGDVGGAQALVERGGDRLVDHVGLARPCRTNSAAPCRTTRSSRSGWRCPCRRCRAPSRAPARTAPCACLVFGSASPSEADGSMPSEPVSIAAMSDSMSPNRLSVTMTSNCFGLRTSCMPPASASMCSSCTSLNSRVVHLA